MLKSNGDKASPGMKPFLIGNMSYICLLIQTAVGFIETLFFFKISVSSFLGVLYSLKILHKIPS